MEPATRNPPGRLFDVGGHRLHLLSVGSAGPTVVFDSALGGSSVSWALVVPEVARFARATTYDRAGFGWSDAGPMTRTAGRCADELAVLLDRAGAAPPFVLVGHSYGGLVMRIFAGRHRTATAGLVLVDPAHPEDWMPPAPKEQAQIDRGVRLCGIAADAARLGIARLVAALVGVRALAVARAIVKVVSLGQLSREDESILAPVWKLPPEARVPLRHFWSQPRFYDALRSQIASIAESAAEVGDATPAGFDDLPLVTISSTNPGPHRLRQQQALARLSTRGCHIIARASGHWIPLDEPSIVVQAVRDVCADAGLIDGAAGPDAPRPA